MSSTTAVVEFKPVKGEMTAAKEACLKEMTPELRRIAAELVTIRGRDSLQSVLRGHAMGELISRVLTDKTNVYGAGSAKQLADFLELSNTYIYNLSTLATTYTVEQIKRHQANLTSARTPLTLSHWMALASVEDGDARAKLLNMTLVESLSVQALIGAISEQAASTYGSATGGRKLGRPASPYQGLQRLRRMGSTQGNYIDQLFLESILRPLRDTPPDRVNDTVLDEIQCAIEVSESLQKKLTEVTRGLRQADGELRRKQGKNDKSDKSVAKVAPAAPAKAVLKPRKAAVRD